MGPTNTTNGGRNGGCGDVVEADDVVMKEEEEYHDLSRMLYLRALRLLPRPGPEARAGEDIYLGLLEGEFSGTTTLPSSLSCLTVLSAAFGSLLHMTTAASAFCCSPLSLLLWLCRC